MRHPKEPAAGWTTLLKGNADEFARRGFFMVSVFVIHHITSEDPRVPARDAVRRFTVDVNGGQEFSVAGRVGVRRILRDVRWDLLELFQPADTLFRRRVSGKQLKQTTTTEGVQDEHVRGSG